MTTQFDALNQLFEQITERLIRIETKLDGKADLNVVGALEGRIRALEIEDAKKEQLRQEFVPRFLELETTVRSHTIEREKSVAVEGFKFDTKMKKAAAGVGGSAVLVTVIKTLIDIIQGFMKL